MFLIREEACPRLIYHGDEFEVIPVPAQIQVVRTGPNSSGIAGLNLGGMLLGTSHIVHRLVMGETDDMRLNCTCVAA
jgi:hypothetical protein